MAAFNPTQPPSSSRTTPPSPNEPPQQRRPFHADHYPDDLPFELSPEEVGLASPHWHTAMTVCGYSPLSITTGHFFTKSVTYHPDWKTRIIRKCEHRLVSASSTFETRERWAVQFYYGGPKRTRWDEVCPAGWDGMELDVAYELEEAWIQEILMTIEQAQSDEIRAGNGVEEELRTIDQAHHKVVKGHGGTFGMCMMVLKQAVEKHEEVLRSIDPGGPRSWEAEADVEKLVKKYAR